MRRGRRTRERAPDAKGRLRAVERGGPGVNAGRPLWICLPFVIASKFTDVCNELSDSSFGLSWQDEKLRVVDTLLDRYLRRTGMLSSQGANCRGRPMTARLIVPGHEPEDIQEFPLWARLSLPHEFSVKLSALLAFYEDDELGRHNAVESSLSCADPCAPERVDGLELTAQCSPTTVTEVTPHMPGEYRKAPLAARIVAMCIEDEWMRLFLGKPRFTCVCPR